jgi:hypothetical protein
MRFKVVLVLSTAFLFVRTSSLQAQILNSASGPSRFSFGADGVLSQAKGEFANNVGRGWGFNLNGKFNLDYKGYLSIRADAGSLTYGRERTDASFLGISSRVNLDLVTTNDIRWGSIGPQIMIPDGPFRPYANAAIAYTDFSTTSSVSDPSGDYQSSSTQNAHDGSHAWIFGGGIQIPIGTTAAFNAGGRYYYGGVAQYLTRGDITDNADGTITLHPRTSKTDMVLWQLGFTIAIPRATSH